MLQRLFMQKLHWLTFVHISCAVGLMINSYEITFFPAAVVVVLLLFVRNYDLHISWCHFLSCSRSVKTNWNKPAE